MMVVSRVCYLSYYKVIYILIGNSRPAKPEKVKVTKTNFISFEHNDDQKNFCQFVFCMSADVCGLWSITYIFWPCDSKYYTRMYLYTHTYIHQHPHESLFG